MFIRLASAAVDGRTPLAETLRIAREGGQAPAPVKAAREVSDEELAQSVQLVAKMMEVDPEAL